MKHVIQLSQDLEDMFWLDASEEDLQTNKEARKVYRKVKKIQKRIKQLDEEIDHKKDNSKTQVIILWILIGLIVLYCAICGDINLL